jgi:hypothetical protein
MAIRWENIMRKRDSVRNASIRGVIGALLLLGTLAAPAAAAPITLNFSGSVDLSPFGEPATSTFAGSLTWDSGAVGSCDPAFCGYDVQATLSINGTDYSGATTARLTLEDDRAIFSFVFSPRLDFNLDIVDFNGRFYVPPGTFPGFALPGNLDFLSVVTQADANFNSDLVNGQVTRGMGDMSLSAPTAVPEPATVTLLAFGLAGLGARRWRQRGQSQRCA